VVDLRLVQVRHGHGHVWWQVSGGGMDWSGFIDVSFCMDCGYSAIILE
jgi:hypothetical protein